MTIHGYVMTVHGDIMIILHYDRDPSNVFLQIPHYKTTNTTIYSLYSKI